MVKLDVITPHTVADTTSGRVHRAGNVGGIALENFVVAIDSGRAESGKSLRHQLETFFDLPVKYLFLTHAHADHRDGLSAFKDLTLVTSQKTAKNMPKSVKLSHFTVEAFAEKFLISDNELSIEFQHVGGHTVGSSIAYFPHEKVLFGGDLFFSGGANFDLPFLSFYQNKGRKTGNPEEYIRAFEKFMTMDIEVIVPGHGSIVFTPKEELQTLLAFFKALRLFFRTAIEEGQELKNIELPNLAPIEQAFARIEGQPTNKKHAEKRWLENYLNHLKSSFYNYYKGKINI
ncbi:MAG: MBL fold metallo-hydrolase [Candidatus Hodarchaeota archaeon]